MRSVTFPRAVGTVRLRRWGWSFALASTGTTAARSSGILLEAEMFRGPATECRRGFSHVVILPRRDRLV